MPPPPAAAALLTALAALGGIGTASAQDDLALYRARALGRDASAQRVLADCLAVGGCLGAAAARPVQACAWRMVILAAGRPEPDPLDYRAYDRDCGRARLGERERAQARREAADLFRAAYGQDLSAARLPPVLR